MRKPKNQCLTCVHHPRDREIHHVLDLCSFVGFQQMDSPEGRVFWSQPDGEKCNGYEKRGEQTGVLTGCAPAA